MRLDQYKQNVSADVTRTRAQPPVQGDGFQPFPARLPLVVGPAKLVACLGGLRDRHVGSFLSLHAPLCLILHDSPPCPPQCPCLQPSFEGTAIGLPA